MGTKKKKKFSQGTICSISGQPSVLIPSLEGSSRLDLGTRLYTLSPRQLIRKRSFFHHYLRIQLYLVALITQL